VAAAIFLISATLDNIPDSPELFNSRSGPSVSLQLVHHDVVAIRAIDVAGQTFAPPAIGVEYVSDALSAVSPALTPQSFYGAADPSPPLI